MAQKFHSDLHCHDIVSKFCLIDAALPIHKGVADIGFVFTYKLWFMAAFLSAPNISLIIDKFP
jgi:hypothetical protein